MRTRAKVARPSTHGLIVAVCREQAKQVRHPSGISAGCGVRTLNWLTIAPNIPEVNRAVWKGVADLSGDRVACGFVQSVPPTPHRCCVPAPTEGHGRMIDGPAGTGLWQRQLGIITWETIDTEEYLRVPRRPFEWTEPRRQWKMESVPSVPGFGAAVRNGAHRCAGYWQIPFLNRTVDSAGSL